MLIPCIINFYPCSFKIAELLEDRKNVEFLLVQIEQLEVIRKNEK